MEGNKIIDFNSMLHRYLYFEYVFSSDDKFEKWPWSTTTIIYNTNGVRRYMGISGIAISIS